MHPLGLVSGPLIIVFELQKPDTFHSFLVKSQRSCWSEHISLSLKFVLFTHMLWKKKKKSLERENRNGLF